MNPWRLTVLVTYLSLASGLEARISNVPGFNLSERASPGKTTPGKVGGGKSGKLKSNLPEVPVSDPSVPDDSYRFSYDGYYYDEKALWTSFGKTADGPLLVKLLGLLVTEPEAYVAPAVLGAYLDEMEQVPDSPLQNQQLNNQVRSGLPSKTVRITEPSLDDETQNTVTVFNPTKPTDVCGAFTSLIRYCDNAETDCACYSSTYYVPDMFNSLAAGCAVMTTQCSTAQNYWCSIGSYASDNLDYCDPAPTDTPVVKFGRTVNLKALSTTSEADAAPQDVSTPTPTPSPSTTQKTVARTTSSTSSTSTSSSSQSLTTSSTSTLSITSPTTTPTPNAAVRARPFQMLKAFV